MLPKGVIGVWAMARPVRSPEEREAVRSLADPRLSDRRNAQRIAAKVVAAYLADAALEDPMERALFEARLRFDPDVAHNLATGETSPVEGQFRRLRVQRFEARGCKQIGPLDWQAETRDIAEAVQAALTRRYRDFLSSVARN